MASTTQSPFRRWLTIDQAATRLGISSETVRRAVKTGSMRAKRRPRKDLSFGSDASIFDEWVDEWAMKEWPDYVGGSDARNG